MTDEEQKEIRKAQKDLSCYTKRLNEAIKLNKEKSIITNQKNIEKAKEILQKYENRVDKREKHFVEFTVALTNAQNSSYAENWQKQTLAYFKQQYPDLKVISAVEHKGQHSPHMHILMQSTDKSIRQILCPQSEKREDFQEAYSAIAHNYHSFANSQIAHNQLNELYKGRKYVSLGQFKQKGNFNAKLADESRKSNNNLNQGANNERNETRKSRKKRVRNERQRMLYMQEQNEIRNLQWIQDTMAVRRDGDNSVGYESRSASQSQHGERRVFSENETRKLYNNELQQVREDGLEQKAKSEAKEKFAELQKIFRDLNNLYSQKKCLGVDEETKEILEINGKIEQLKTKMIELTAEDKQQEQQTQQTTPKIRRR